MPREREEKKEEAIVAGVSKPLPAYPLLSAVRFWRRGWLAREKLMAEREGRAENDDVQKTNRSWRIPDSARFSNAPEKLPVRRETFLAAGCHIGTQASGYREWT